MLHRIILSAWKELNLLDLEFNGEKCTCSHKQSGNTQILTRLDRVRANQEWTTFRPHAKVYQLDPSLSDHIPIWTDTTHDKEKFSYPFKFQNHWTLMKASISLLRKLERRFLEFSV